MPRRSCCRAACTCRSACTPRRPASSIGCSPDPVPQSVQRPGPLLPGPHRLPARLLRPGLATACSRFAARLPGSLESERRLLDGERADGAGRYARRGASAAQRGPTTTGWPYARFNLGVALVRSGDVAQGSAWLEARRHHAGARPTSSCRCATAPISRWASRCCSSSEAEPAVAALTRVRLDGPFTNRALLGLGWAESDAKRPDRALVPWLELRERRLLDSAVQESYLAVPYAYAQLASNGQAAQQYRYAVAGLSRGERAHRRVDRGDPQRRLPRFDPRGRAAQRRGRLVLAAAEAAGRAADPLPVSPARVA